jgi:hypothetical protein
VRTAQPGPAGPQQILDEVDAFWWKLWLPDNQTIHPDRWFETFDDFPAFPEVSPLTADTLASVIRAVPAGKAAGRDGWTYGDLKRMPAPALELLCDIFKCTERTGVWPEPIAHSFVAMLPKGGSGEPDDFRPVVLLSVFYRLWAKCRGREFQAFLRLAGVTPADRPNSAEQLAFDLAIRIAIAQAGGAAVSGLALDWSKCYDHLLLGLLHKLSAKLGIPAAIAKPMLAAYAQPRAVLLNGSIGPERRPVAGLAPGCPRATDWLALVIFMYTKSLVGAVPNVASRPYVDDITSDVTTGDVDESCAAVTAMVTHTMQFASDLAFKPNLIKSRRFSTSKEVRARLKLEPGPPLADAFLDLGVAQTPVRIAPAPFVRKRVGNGIGKLERTSVLSLSLLKRGRFAAASGVPSATYGSSVTALSIAALRSLQTAAFHAVWRSGARSAQELVFGLFVPWRGSPSAVCTVQPIQFLRDAIRRGVLDVITLAGLLDVRTPTGPVHAFVTACSRGGITLSLDATSMEFRGGLRMAWLSDSWYLVRQAILGSHTAKSYAAVALRRPGIAAALAHGIDRGLTLRFENSAWQESRKAALRVVLAGGVIVQKLAARWVAGGDRCPHCKLAVEDLSHLFWACPRWEKLRHTSLGSHSKAALLRLFGPASLNSGIIPNDRALVNAQAAAEACGSWPAVVQLPERVWTDGSCLHPADSPLRRATWGVVGRKPDGFDTLGAAIVHGRQTIGRAELSAIIWVSRCPGEAHAVIDAKYLTFCLGRCIGNTCPAALLEGKNGDLWRLLLRQVSLTWVKAHLTALQAEALGISEEDRLGNDAADLAASSLARTIAPSAELVVRRQYWKEGADALHCVLGSIQEAALDAHHAPGSAVRGRRRAKRARPKPKAKRPAIAKPVPPPLAEAAPGAVVHVLSPMIGPVVAGNSATWTCNLCNDIASGPTRLRPFAKALCHAEPRAALATKEVHLHDLVRVAGGWACARCRLGVPSHRRAAAARAKCPVPVVLVGHVPCALSCRQIQRNLSALELWRAPTVVAPGPPGPVVGPLAAPFRLVWRSHWIVAGGGRTACLSCGRAATARARVGLAASPCTGVAEVPSAGLVGPLLAGIFDASLDRAPPAWRARAVALRWRRIAASGGGPVGILVRNDPAAMPPD